ncbi:hypothetical protein K1W54_04980 [Micromonospora sp. CPCC 205371]|nr:hypothetical protein [Micromonospora sp. CPCC 205371]
MTAEPMCCGTPMVHNSWTEEYECADAYFRLLDDGVLDGTLALLAVDDEHLTPYQRERYEHWRTVRVPDAARSAEYVTTSPKD